MTVQLFSIISELQTPDEAFSARAGTNFVSFYSFFPSPPSSLKYKYLSDVQCTTCYPRLCKKKRASSGHCSHHRVVTRSPFSNNRVTFLCFFFFLWFTIKHNLSGRSNIEVANWCTSAEKILSLIKLSLFIIESHLSRRVLLLAPFFLFFFALCYCALSPSICRLFIHCPSSSSSWPSFV